MCFLGQSKALGPHAPLNESLTDDDVDRVKVVWAQLIGNYKIEVVQAMFLKLYTKYPDTAAMFETFRLEQTTDLNNTELSMQDRYNNTNHFVKVSMFLDFIVANLHDPDAYIPRLNEMEKFHLNFQNRTPPVQKKHFEVFLREMNVFAEKEMGRFMSPEDKKAFRLFSDRLMCHMTRAIVGK